MLNFNDYQSYEEEAQDWSISVQDVKSLESVLGEKLVKFPTNFPAKPSPMSDKQFNYLVLHPQMLKHYHNDLKAEIREFEFHPDSFQPKA